MTRSHAPTVSARRAGTDLDAWLLDERDLTTEERTLLAAYRDAADQLRKALPTQPSAPTSESRAPEGESEEPATPQVRVQPVVPRLHAAAGLEPGSLAGLHGQLLAAGYLAAEIIGRSDGLSYRITREGLRRLSDENEASEAA